MIAPGMTVADFAFASVLALSVCRRTRTASVSKPLSMTQALNGERHGPVWRRKLWMWSAMNFSLARMIPPSTRP